MKIIILYMCICFLLPVQPDVAARYASCLSCLAAAKEIERVLKETPAESREAAVDSLISGSVCKNLLANEHFRVSKNKMESSCRHLFETHYDQFQDVLVKKEPKLLTIALCYEISTTCVGVKLQSFEDSTKNTFSEAHLEALLRENKENVRIAQPTYSESPLNTRDEL